MKIISKYIFKEQIYPFLTTFLFLTFILLLNRLFVLADLIISKNIETHLVFQLFLLMLPAVVSFTMPMSLLISVIMAMGRLSSDSEIVALRASGISTFHIIKPVLLLGVIFFTIMIIFNDTLLVYSNKNYNKLFVRILKSSPMAVLEDKIFASMGSKTIWVEKIDKNENRLNNILLYNKNEGGGWDVIKAERGAWKQNSDGSKILHLFNGRLFSNEIKNDTYSIVDFSNGEAEIMITEGRIDYNENKRKPNPTEMNSAELYKIVKNSGKSYMEDRDIARYMVELFKKHAIPFSCLVFSIIGTPIGLFSKRSGRGIGFGLSIIVFFVYYVFFMTGQSLAIRGLIHPFIGVWGSNIILLLAGCIMIVYKEKFSF